MVTDGSLTGFTGSAGYNGIVVALFGGLNPLWTILSSFIFAGLLVGGDAMQVVTNVPSDLIVALNGLVVVFVVSVEFLRRRRTCAGGDAVRRAARAVAAARGAARRDRGACMNEFFTVAILTATVASGIQLAAPFLLASLGETLGQRSGVLNLGVDGIMLLGAFTSYYVALETDDLRLAVLAGIAVGVAAGLATAFISVTLRAEQGISGIGVYLFALGLTSLLFLKLVGTPTPIDQPGKVEVPLPERVAVPRQDPLPAGRARLHRVRARPCRRIRAQPDDVRDEHQGGRREPRGRRQPRRQRRAHALRDRHRSAARSRASQARR